MPRQPVIAYHVIWTAYGTWLPNDLRGSTSHSIASDEIAALGPLHFGRRKKQPPRDVVLQFYRRADEVLKYPQVHFSPREIDVVAAGLAEGIQQNAYTCYAAAIMPDHVHLVICKHRQTAEEMTARLQGQAAWRCTPNDLTCAPANIRCGPLVPGTSSFAPSSVLAIRFTTWNKTP
jgi:hypothetical protein